MKANEAPKKIYLANTEYRTLEGWHRKTFAINGIECVEYTRTDAFIEKACAILEGISSQYVVEQFKSRII